MGVEGVRSSMSMPHDQTDVWWELDLYGRAAQAGASMPRHCMPSSCKHMTAQHAMRVHSNTWATQYGRHKQKARSLRFRGRRTSSSQSDHPPPRLLAPQAPPRAGLPPAAALENAPATRCQALVPCRNTSLDILQGSGHQQNRLERRRGCCGPLHHMTPSLNAT